MSSVIPASSITKRFFTPSFTKITREINEPHCPTTERPSSKCTSCPGRTINSCENVLKYSSNGGIELSGLS